jgi:hypothetical protein
MAAAEFDENEMSLPSDEQLDHVVKDYRQGMKAEVERQAGDPEIYEKRLAKRGWTPEPRARWIWDKRTKSKRPIVNRRHAASAAVHDGTIALTTTEHPPARLTLPFWYTVDGRKAIDHHRKDQRYVLLPDLIDDETGEQIEGITALTDHVAHETGKASAEYQAAVADAEEQEKVDNVAVQKLAREAGVSELDLELTIQNKRLRVTVRRLGDQEGVSHVMILKRIGRALCKLKAHPGGEQLLKRMGWL